MSLVCTVSKEPLSIVSLLPYTEDSQLIDKQQKLADLYLLREIVNIALQALPSFLNADIKAFDAQLGENLCQIRAY